MYDYIIVIFCSITLLLYGYDVVVDIKKRGWKDYFFSEENKYKKRYELLILSFCLCVILIKMGI